MSITRVSKIERLIIKPGKSDCTDGMLSDNLMNGTLKLNRCISVLFSALLIYGVATGGLFLSTLVPTPKNKRENKTDSNNYRAIAIDSLLGKLCYLTQTMLKFRN